MTEENTRYAGFWIRFLAYIIDQFIIGIANFILLAPLWIIFGLSAFSFEKFEEYDRLVREVYFIQMEDEFSIAFFSILFFLIIGAIIISMLIQWLYYALMESSYRQGTLGKMAVGIKVTDMEGNRISFGKASGRFFAKIISGLILNIGYIMAAFTEKKQGLHDMISSCLVVYK